WKRGLIGRARQLLEDTALAGRDSGAPDLREWEWYFTEGLCDLCETGNVRSLSGHSDTINALATIPGQGHPILVSAGADTTIRLWDGLTGREIKSLVGSRELTGLGFRYEKRDTDNAYVVTRLFGGGPAVRDGRLKLDDRIVAVASGESPLEDVNALTAKQISQRLEDVAAGTKVRLQVEHPNTASRETVELIAERFNAQVKHDAPVIRLAVSPDGKYLVSADTVGQLLVWDLATGEPASGIYTQKSVLDIAFSPNGRWLAICFEDRKKLFFAKLANLQPPQNVPSEEKPITAFAFGPGDQLAVATNDGVIHLHDVEKGVELRQLSFGEANLAQLAFSPDGRLLAASSNTQIALFDLQNPAASPHLLSDPSYHLRFAFHPTGHYLATAGSDGVVRVWDVGTQKEVRTLRGHKSPVATVTFLDDNFTLASGAYDQAIRLWNLRKTAPEVSRGFRIDDYRDNVGICFSADQHYLAVSDPWDRRIAILDALTGHKLRSIAGKPWRTQFLPSEPVLAVPDDNFAIRLIDVTTGEQKPNSPIFQGHRAAIRSIAFSGEGTRMASGDEKGDVFVWNVATGEAVPLPGRHEMIKAVAVSPDGKWVAASSPDERRVRIWEVASARLAHELPYSTVGYCLRFSPDSTLLVTDDRTGRLHLVSLATGKDEKILVAHTGVIWDAAFSPDGRRLLTLSADRTMRLWDVGTGRSIFALDENKSYTAAAFSADGLRLATVLNDQVKVWDAALFTADRKARDWLFYAVRGRYYEELEDWPESIDNFTHALRSEPAELSASGRRDFAWIQQQRGYAYAALGNLQQAEGDFSEVVKQFPDDTEALGNRADAELALGKRSDYLEICRQCCEIALKKHEAHASNTAAWLCSLVPGAPGDLQALISLMRETTQENPKGYAYRSTLGSILYRAGEYQEAITTLRAAMTMRPLNSVDSSSSAKALDHDQDGTAWEWVFLAMANFRLGDRTAANKWLKQVADRFDLVSSDPIFDDPNWTWDWNDVFQLKLLYKEAQDLINGPQP
ncbi:MAG: tetratricopeptide repeat protein, partial [Verrucomicrobia bacterium]|nr:tetratricopeptide repeat protein [Verrucomicrobiota bacterium]